MYTKKLIKLLIWGVLGFALGFALYVSQDGLKDGLGLPILAGWVVGGIPYGWQVSKRVVPTVVSTSLPITFILLAFRFVIAAFTGMFATPVEITRCIIYNIRENRETRGV